MREREGGEEGEGGGREEKKEEKEKSKKGNTKLRSIFRHDKDYNNRPTEFSSPSRREDYSS